MNQSSRLARASLMIKISMPFVNSVPRHGWRMTSATADPAPFSHVGPRAAWAEVNISRPWRRYRIMRRITLPPIALAALLVLTLAGCADTRSAGSACPGYRACLSSCGGHVSS